MSRNIACALAAIILSLNVLSLSAANAGTLTYAGYQVLNNQTVQLVDEALGLNETGGSGMITLTGIDGGNTALETFCIDVAQWLQPAGAFSTGASLTGAFGDTVNALLTNALPTLGSIYDASSALQIAIWKAEYGAALSITGPNGAIALANQYLDNVAANRWTADPSMQVAVLDGQGITQSQAYLSPVPEPATIAVLVVGLVGLAASRRLFNRI